MNREQFDYILKNQTEWRLQYEQNQNSAKGRRKASQKVYRENCRIKTAQEEEREPRKKKYGPFASLNRRIEIIECDE